MALARSEGSQAGSYSMSAQIRAPNATITTVSSEQTQKGTLNVTGWIEWFLDCLDRAFAGAEGTLAKVLEKARFWEAHAAASFNERQRKVLNHLLDGFREEAHLVEVGTTHEVFAGHGRS